MQSVLGFVNDNRVRGINHAVGDDHITTHRQAVHEDPVVRRCHLLFIDEPVVAELRSVRDIRGTLPVKSTAAPTLCIYDLDIVERCIHVGRELNGSTGRLRLLLDLVGKLTVETIPFRMRDSKVVTELGRGQSKTVWNSHR